MNAGSGNTVHARQRKDGCQQHAVLTNQRRGQHYQQGKREADRTRRTGMAGRGTHQAQRKRQLRSEQHVLPDDPHVQEHDRIEEQHTCSGGAQP